MGLLKYYLTELEVASEGRSKGYSLEAFKRHIDLACLEYGRTVFGYQLKGKGPEFVKNGVNILGRCAHNRSFDHLFWMIRLTRPSQGTPIVSSVQCLT